MDKRTEHIGMISHTNFCSKNTSYWEISIKIYIGEPLYESFFIANSIQGQLIIGPTKKMIATYMVGDLTLMDLWGHKH